MRGLMIAAALTLGTTAMAEPPAPLTGTDLHTFCVDTFELRESEFFCAAYVFGMTEGVFWGSAISLLKTGVLNTSDDILAEVDQIFEVCIPPEIDRRQLVDIFRAELRENPSERHKRARYLYFKALKRHYPCD